MTAPARRARAADILAPLVVLAAGLLAFRSSFSGVFVLDDEPSIVQNPNIRSLWPLAEAMSAPAEVTVAGRPIVSLTLAVNYVLDGLDPWNYHALNLAVHLAAALVLLGVARRTLLAVSERRGGSFPADAARPVAFAIALLWCIHPLQTGSVTYIVQRAESLMGLFYLLTLYCAIRALEPRGRGWWLAGSIIACGLGMGSKEVMISAPIMVWLWDRLFGTSTQLHAQGSHRLVLYIGLAATWAILASLMWTHPRTHSVGFGFVEWPWWRYLLTQLGVIAHYLRLAIVPAPLVLDYGWAPASSIVDVVPHAALVGGLAGITGWLLWRRRPAGFLGAWFFAILAPTSSVVPIVTEVAAEHRMYLPLAAVVSAVVIAADVSLRRLGDGVRSAIAYSAIAVLVIALTAVTDARNRDYASEEGLWRDTVQKRPQNPRAHNNYGIDLLRKGDVTTAERHFRSAVALDARFADAYVNLGVALCSLGKCDEGIERMQQALLLSPPSTHAHRDLGEAYASQGRHGPAIEHFLRALDVQPDDVFLLNRAGWLLATSPERPLRNGQKALALAERAVRLTARRDEISLDTLAAALGEVGKFSDAAAAATDALSIAREKGNRAIIPELEQRLAQYRNAIK